jgi:regulator of protease activity HflC (stomatin/prohibitin superfamily)
LPGGVLQVTIGLEADMKRAMARQAEAEREKRAKIINAQGESFAAAAPGEVSDTMMARRSRCSCATRRVA